MAAKPKSSMRKSFNHSSSTDLAYGHVKIVKEASDMLFKDHVSFSSFGKVMNHSGYGNGKGGSLVIDVAIGD